MPLVASDSNSLVDKPLGKQTLSLQELGLQDQQQQISSPAKNNFEDQKTSPICDQKAKSITFQGSELDMDKDGFLEKSNGPTPKKVISDEIFNKKTGEKMKMLTIIEENYDNNGDQDQADNEFDKLVEKAIDQHIDQQNKTPRQEQNTVGNLTKSGHVIIGTCPMVESVIVGDGLHLDVEKSEVGKKGTEVSFMMKAGIFLPEDKKVSGGDNSQMGKSFFGGVTNNNIFTSMICDNQNEQQIEQKIAAQTQQSNTPVIQQQSNIDSRNMTNNPFVTVASMNANKQVSENTAVNNSNNGQGDDWLKFKFGDTSNINNGGSDNDVNIWGQP